MQQVIDSWVSSDDFIACAFHTSHHLFVAIGLSYSFFEVAITWGAETRLGAIQEEHLELTRSEHCRES